MVGTVIPANAGIQIFRMLLDPRFRAGDDVDELFNWLLWGCTPGFRVSPLRGSATTAQLAVARANGAEFDD